MDFLTQGRIIPTFGTGWNEDEFNVVGYNFSNRGKRMDEQMQVISSLWRGENKFTGKFHKYDNVSFFPRSPSLSQIPLIVAGNSEFAIKRATTYGNGWHPIGFPPKELSRVIEKHQAVMKKPGYQIWLRVMAKGPITEQELQGYASIYEEIGVTGLILDRSRNEDINPLHDLQDPGKLIQNL